MSTELATGAATPNALAPINPESIILTALDKGVSVETMEKLLAMREQLRKEQSKSAFLAALSAFQQDCPVIFKDKEVLNKDGRSVRYRYAPMESIIRQVGPILARHGFSYSFNTESANDAVTVHCTASHSAGHSEATSFVSKIDPAAFMNLAQKFGSALTFAKRYAFCNAFGIVTGDDDDDGQSTTETTGEATARERLEKIRREKEKAQRAAEPPAQVVHQSDEAAPESEGMALLTEFLAGILECEEADKLTAMVAQSAEFEGPQLKAAKRAIKDRADWLGLVWDAEIKEFIKPAAH